MRSLVRSLIVIVGSTWGIFGYFRLGPRHAITMTGAPGSALYTYTPPWIPFDDRSSSFLSTTVARKRQEFPSRILNPENTTYRFTLLRRDIT